METAIVLVITIFLPLIPQLIANWLIEEQEHDESHYEYDYR